MSSGIEFRQRGVVPPERNAMQSNPERSGSFSKNPKIEQEQQSYNRVVAIVSGVSIFALVYFAMGGVDVIVGVMRGRPSQSPLALATRTPSISPFRSAPKYFSPKKCFVSANKLEKSEFKFIFPCMSIGLRQRHSICVTSNDPNINDDMPLLTRQRPVIAAAIQRFPGDAANRKLQMKRYFRRIGYVLIVTAIYTAFVYNSGGASNFLGNNNNMHIAATNSLQIASWNTAAINNNPFEYWITYEEEPAYEKLMISVEKFLENPGDRDVPVDQVFTSDMFDQLDKRIRETAGWPSVRSYWESDFSKRKIVSGFMKDAQLGLKRLASMPDRITNTITTSDGKTVFRPTVINMYEGDLGTQQGWWKAWETFMFDTQVSMAESGKAEIKVPYSMLVPIKRSKYKDVTEQEEKDSLQLQTLCGAIFDAILVHMMNEVADSPQQWQDLKKVMVENLNRKKVPHTLDILQSQYTDSDIITLQEVSSELVRRAKKLPLSKIYHIISPADADSARDQNSVIFLKRTRFLRPGKEITSDLKKSLPPGTLSAGDLLVLEVEDTAGTTYRIASFHGDTGGQATVPVTEAVISKLPSSHKLIFGLDANTYEHGDSKKKDVMEYETFFRSHSLLSCWGTKVNPANYTTYNARTFLQPQLNKACRQSEKREKGDVNPKDFVLFRESDFTVTKTWKDNTGKKQYIEDMAFPTLQFPSDHGILATVLQEKGK